MWLEIASAAYLLGDAAYHRWFEDKPKPKPIREFQLPRVDEGATIPIFYGRCRVRQPILAWIGQPDATQLDNLAAAFNTVSGAFLYGADMLFAIGMPFDGQVAHIYNMWAGDTKFEQQEGMFSYYLGPVHNNVKLSGLIGSGNHERNSRKCVSYVNNDGMQMSGEVEFLNGSLTLEVFGDGPAFTSKTWTGDRMIVAGTATDEVPSFRSVAMLFMGRMPVEDDDPGDAFDFFVDELPDGFILGTTPNVPPLSFEMWSITQTPLYTQSPGGGLVDSGDGYIECNPADVIFDLITGKNGKLGIPVSRVDLVSFKAAATTLAQEGHGFSRSFEDPTEAREMIQEICRQIDAVVYEDPDDLLIKIKLVRDDFDPFTVPVLDHTNARFSNWELNGFPNIVNKIRVVFTDRRFGYTDNSAEAHNQANAVGQDGQVREVVLQVPGCCTLQLAKIIAQREMNARSRPVAKCRARTSRKQKSLRPGDVVAVRDKETGVDGVLFRIAKINRGDPDDEEISFELIQDIFHIHRGIIQPGNFSPFPGVSTQV